MKNNQAVDNKTEKMAGASEGQVKSRSEGKCKKTSKAKVGIYILLAAFLFGTMETTCKLGATDIDAYQLTFLRFAIGGLFMAPFAIAAQKKKGIKLRVKDHLWFLFLGTLCVPFSMMFFQFGVENSNASTMAVVFCTNPLFTMVIAHLFTSDKMNRTKTVAFILALVGIVFMIKPWNMQAGNSVIGFVYIMVAAISFSAYTVISKRTIGKFGNILQTFWCFFYGSIVLFFVMLILKRPIIAGVMDHIPLIIYVGVFVTGLGYLCFFQGVALSTPSTGSIAFLIKAVIAPIIAVICLGEVLLYNSYIGMAFIVAASLLVLYDNNKKMRE